jgi:hypothetical protein
MQLSTRMELSACSDKHSSPKTKGLTLDRFSALVDTRGEGGGGVLSWHPVLSFHKYPRNVCLENFYRYQALQQVTS